MCSLTPANNLSDAVLHLSFWIRAEVKIASTSGRPQFWFSLTELWEPSATQPAGAEWSWGTMRMKCQFRCCWWTIGKSLGKFSSLSWNCCRWMLTLWCFWLCLVFCWRCVLLGLVWFRFAFASLHAFVPSLTGAQRTDSSPASKKSYRWTLTRA